MSSGICVALLLVVAVGMLGALNSAGNVTNMFIGKTNLLDNLDSAPSVVDCNPLNPSMADLFVFPDEVPFMDNISVCYYGTNATELDKDIMNLMSLFIVYQQAESGHYKYVDRFRLQQSVSSSELLNAKACNCLSIDMTSFPNRSTLRFGVYIHNRCRPGFCPMKLYSFSNSSTVLHTSLPDIRFKDANHDMLIEELRIENASRACLDLNIRIEIQDGPDPNICDILDPGSYGTSPSDSPKFQNSIWISVTIVTVFIISTLVVVAVVSVCFRLRHTAKQEYSAEEIRHEEMRHYLQIQGHLAPPTDIMSNRRASESNNYCGMGPSTLNGDEEANIILMCGNYTLLAGEPRENCKYLSIEDIHDYEEPYFEPATKLEELMAQLKKFGVTEISRESKSLRLFKGLGSGAFGTVYRGLWIHARSSTTQQLVEDEVAVKSMDETNCEEERVKFLQEAAIMGQFNHPNIIKILGIVSDDPIMIVIEIMKNGDLRNHLLSIKMKSCAAELPPTLLSYSRQIASGMVYLALKEFVHRDLAARNVLVSDTGTCKIADFGMSRELQDTNYYICHGGKIPVKWTAPEALHYHKYSTASDVWSYGCVLYEIWSLGYKPFHDHTNAEAMKKMGIGFRLAPPPGCPKAVYDIMMQCWHPTADQRPSFFDVTVALQKPDFILLHWISDGINMHGEKARILGAPLQDGHQLHMDLQKAYLMRQEQENNQQQAKDNSKPRQQQDEDNSKPSQQQDEDNSKPSQQQDEDNSKPSQQQDEDNSKPSQQQDEDNSKPSQQQDEDNSKPSQQQDEDNSKPSQQQDEDNSKPSQQQDEDNSKPSQQQDENNSKSSQQQDEDNSKPSQQQDEDNSEPSQQQDEHNSKPSQQQDEDNSKPSQQQDEDNSKLTDMLESSYECYVKVDDVDDVVHDVEENKCYDSDDSDGYAQPCPDSTSNVLML